MPTTEQKEQATETPTTPTPTKAKAKEKAPKTVTSNDVGEQTRTKASK